jgi:hypothetical protein
VATPVFDTYAADDVAVREHGIGTLNLKLPEPHPVCTICGCDCTGFRFEFYGFATIDSAYGSCPIEYVLITTCRDHWHEPLACRLRAAA